MRKVKHENPSNVTSGSFARGSTALIALSPVHSARKALVVDLSSFRHLGLFAVLAMNSLLSFIRNVSRRTAVGTVNGVKRWLSSNITQDAIIKQLSTRTEAPFDLRQVSHNWAACIKNDPNLKSSTKSQYISNIRSFLIHLEAEGVITKSDLPRNIKGSALRVAHKPTLADLVPVTSKHSLHSGTKKKAATAASHLLLDEGRREESPGAALERINSLLGALRSLAEERVRQIMAEFDAAEALVARFDRRLVSELAPCLHLARPQLHHHRRYRAKMFRDPVNLIGYLVTALNGIPPSKAADPQLDRLLRNRCGLEALLEKTILTQRSLLPFFILILIETAGNPEEIMTMEDDCINAISPGMVEFTWNKNRSGGRPQSVIMPFGSRKALLPQSSEPISAAVAIECLLRLRGRAVSIAHPEDSRRLFLYYPFGGAITKKPLGQRQASCEYNGIARSWRIMRKSSALLASLGVRLDSIRGTMLLKREIESQGNIFDVQRLANHKSIETTKKYLDGTTAQMTLRARVRQGQEFIVANALANNAQLLDRAGVADDAAADFIKRGVQKGFGLRCSNDVAGVAPGTVPGKPCSRLEYCGKCSHVFVVEDKETAANLIALRESIMDQEGDICRQNASMWTSYWEPTVEFIDDILDQFDVHVLADGRTSAEHLDYSYVRFTYDE